MEIRNYEYVLVPNILRNYKCSTSGECCQSKWRIDIDEIAYEKTKKELEKLNESAEMYFNKNDKNEYTTKFANGYCKLITEEKLCRVHKEFGWECLSDTCKVYPRILKLTSRGIEMGIVFSCRSSAKLLLSDEEVKIEKVKKDDIFFMKPSSINFIIPENNLPTNPAYRYYELESFLLEVMNKKGSVGKKLQYIKKILKEYYECDKIIDYDFNKALDRYSKDKDKKFSSKDINDYIIKIILTKEKEGSKVVTNEFINLLKVSRLTKNIEEDKEALRDSSFSLTIEELEEMKMKWNKKEEKILNNYVICNIFNKEFYNTRKFAMMKLLMLSVMLKFRILLYKKYLGRELTDEELIYVIKSHDNDFSHGANFFNSYYNENKMGIDVEVYCEHLITMLYTNLEEK